MKFRKIAAGVLSVTLLLTACGQAGEGDAFSQLLTDTAEKNAALNAPTGELDAYRYDFEQGGPLLTEAEFSLLRREEKTVGILTGAEARAEVDYLFRLLRTYYGLYTWFGGDEAFGAAEERVLRALEGREEIPVGKYQQLLKEALGFVQDGHFGIGGSSTLEPSALYCAEESLFDYRDGTFYGGEDLKRKVTAIQGEDPANYLKRAIGPEGELTWKLYRTDVASGRSSAVVTYADGEETIILDPAGMDPLDQGKETFRRSTLAGAELLQMTSMPFVPGDAGPEWGYDGATVEAFLAAAEEARTADGVLVVDLTSNPGGNGNLPGEWFRAFTGETPEPNYATLCLDPYDWTCREGEVKEGDYRVRRPEEQYLEREEGPFLVVLTSHGTASAAEAFTDLTRNVGRSLIIGSNTGGCLTGSQTYRGYLPWSGTELAWGLDLFVWPEGYFAEGVGLEPDVYLTGPDQEARLEQFLQRYLTG